MDVDRGFGGSGGGGRMSSRIFPLLEGRFRLKTNVWDPPIGNSIEDIEGCSGNSGNFRLAASGFRRRVGEYDCDLLISVLPLSSLFGTAGDGLAFLVITDFNSFLKVEPVLEKCVDIKENMHF